MTDSVQAELARLEKLVDMFEAMDDQHAANAVRRQIQFLTGKHL